MTDWTNATPTEILKDLNAMIMESQGWTGPDTVILPYATWLHMRALQIFGQNVNRANRHKFRRVKLALMSGWCPE